MSAHWRAVPFQAQRGLHGRIGTSGPFQTGPLILKLSIRREYLPGSIGSRLHTQDRNRSEQLSSTSKRECFIISTVRGALSATGSLSDATGAAGVARRLSRAGRSGPVGRRQQTCGGGILRCRPTFPAAPAIHSEHVLCICTGTGGIRSTAFMEHMSLGASESSLPQAAFAC